MRETLVILQKRYILPILFCLLVFIKANGQNCNLISNPDFYSGLEGWTTVKVNNGAVAELQINLKNEMIVKTIIPGKKSGDVRAACQHIYLEKGQRYTITFKGYAKSSKEVDVAFVNMTNPSTVYFKKEIKLDTINQEYKVSFLMMEETDSEASFQIFLSDNSTKMYFDDFYLANDKCLSGEQKRVTNDPILIAQKTTDRQPPKAVFKNGFERVNVNGYVRFFTLYRNLKKSYANAPLAPKTFIVNGVYPDSPIESGLQSGYREPFVNLEFSANPSKKTFVKFDLLLDNQLTGSLSDSSKRIQVYRYVNFEGNTRTDFGNIKFKLGGVHFENLSEFTLWNYQFRDDMFERYPWEWAEYSFDKYNNFYTEKSLARDSRFGSASFQGVVLEGVGLPHQLNIKLMFGKANGTNNGFNSFLNNNYKYIAATRVEKQIQNHSVGVVYYNQHGFIDDISSKKDKSNIEDEKIVTTTGSLNFEKVNVQYEGGIASFTNPDKQNREWSPVLMAKTNIAFIRKLPISIQAYHIGENYLNVNSAVMNNSRYGGTFGLEEQYNSVSFQGGLGEFGQMASNRQGVNISGGRNWGKLKVGLGIGFSQELKNDRNGISFQHRLAGLNRSRFEFYRSNVGPYNRIQNIWRHSYQVLSIDSMSYGAYSKGFSTIDVSLKYKTKLFHHDLILGNYTNYNSIQDGWAILPKFKDEAFVRTVYNEINCFYKITKATTIVAQLGYEVIKGNEYTDQTVDGLPIDQSGESYGIGLDIDFGRTAGIYIRQKWYHHRDKNFTLDEFKGSESSVEFKIWF